MIARRWAWWFGRGATSTNKHCHTSSIAAITTSIARSGTVRAVAASIVTLYYALSLWWWWSSMWTRRVTVHR